MIRPLPYVISILLFFLFFQCVGTPPNTYRKNLQNKDLYEACFAYLSENSVSLSTSENEILKELQAASRSESSQTYFTGEIVFDLVSKQGRHLQLDRFGRIEYFRSSPLTLNAKEGMDFLCAEHIRWILEKKFQETAEAIKMDPVSAAYRKSAEENLRDYLRFSEALRNKNLIVRNFLFLELNRYLAGDKGLPISPCGYSGKMQDPIRIATKELENPSVRLAWAHLIQTITAYELGFTLAGYCN